MRASESTGGVVRLVNAEKILTGHRKMVQTQVLGEVDTALLQFIPDGQREYILLADAAIEDRMPPWWLGIGDQVLFISKQALC